MSVNAFREMQSSLFIGAWDWSYQGDSSTNTCDYTVWKKAYAEYFRLIENEGDIAPTLKYSEKNIGRVQ